MQCYAHRVAVFEIIEKLGIDFVERKKTRDDEARAGVYMSMKIVLGVNFSDDDRRDVLS